MTDKPFIYITEKKVRSVLGEKKAFELAHKVFELIACKKTVMPPKIYLPIPKINDFRAMPAFLEDSDRGLCGIKWVSVFPENRLKGFPTVNATILLNSSANGRLLAVIEAGVITALRTGAAAAVASFYMARRDSKVLMIVGAGLQAEYQLRALNNIYRFEKVYLWGFASGEAKSLCKRLYPEFPNLKPCSDLKRGVREADIIVTCTPSRKPLVKASWIKRGTHINAIGADAKGKQELESELLTRSKVVVDEWEQASHSGEINVPVSSGLFSKNNLYAQLSEIVSKKKKGRGSASEITVFDSTGLAVLDIYFADHVYRNLKKAPRTTP